MLSDHSPDTLLKPSPILDLKSERAVILGLRRMLRAVSDIPEPVLNLPRKITLPGGAVAIFETTDRYEFSPLPVLTFEKLRKAHLEITPFGKDRFAAPSDDSPLSEDHILTSWAEPVANTCCVLTIARDDLWTRNKEQIECAGFTFYPNSESQRLLLNGERGIPDPRRPLWYAESFFESPSGRHGCIITTYAEQRLEPKHVLRSELLALLVLLEFAGICALKKDGVITGNTSFTGRNDKEEK